MECSNEKGITLLETIATLLITSIVFLLLFSIIQQLNNFSNRIEEKNTFTNSANIISAEFISFMMPIKKTDIDHQRTNDQFIFLKKYGVDSHENEGYQVNKIGFNMEKKSFDINQTALPSIYTKYLDFSESNFEYDSSYSLIQLNLKFKGDFFEKNYRYSIDIKNDIISVGESEMNN